MNKDRIEVSRVNYEFLRYVLFGNAKEPFPRVSNNAYRDLCRTIKFNKIKKNKTGEQVKVDAKQKINELLKEEISLIIDKKDNNQVSFDKWHEELCNKIIAIFKELSDSFSIGHAQKWINMTLKYLHIYEDATYDLSTVFKYLHVPIDQYVWDQASLIGIPKPKVKNDAWSNINDYSEYLNYQRELRSKVYDKYETSLMDWESTAWLKSTSKQS